MTDRPDTEAVTEPAAWSDNDLLPDGAPAIAVSGIDLSRATIVSSADHDDSGAHWHIAAVPLPDSDPPRLCIVGDLSHRAGGWFVGVTAVCFLAFRDPSQIPESEDELREATRVLGAWVSCILYDTAAAAARRLVASTIGCDMEIPILTPRPHFAQLERASEDEVASTQ